MNNQPKLTWTNTWLFWIAVMAMCCGKLLKRIAEALEAILDKM